MECLILKTEPVGESDLLATALTREGERREAFVRSARAADSRVRAGLQPVIVSDVLFAPGRGLWVVRNALPMFPFPAFRRSLRAGAFVQVLAAVLTEASGPPPDSRLSASATRMFRDLHTAVAAREHAETLARRFCGALLQALGLSGFAPAFGRCARCGQVRLGYGARRDFEALSASAGGVVCSSCVRNESYLQQLSREALNDLAQRRIPRGRKDVEALLRFSLACAAWQIPSVAPQCRWAASLLFSRPHNSKMQAERHSATIG